MSGVDDSQRKAKPVSERDPRPKAFWEVFGELSDDFERPEQVGQDRDDITDLPEGAVASVQLALIPELRGIPEWNDEPS